MQIIKLVDFMLKRLFFLLAAAAFLSLPCLAADSADAPVLDAAELDELMAPFVEKHELDETNFGLAFLYTGTNESYFMNGDNFMYAASMYKVPLCMLVAEKVSSGELRQEDSFHSVPITRIEEYCIIGSNNKLAAAAYNGFRPHTAELLTKYSGMSIDELPSDYRNQFYSPRFMLNTLQTLYEEPERFPHIIECMLQTQPENYFRQTLEGQYEVAQKYGQYTGLLHNAGIIYTPTPIILVVMTNRVEGSMELIGEMAKLFADYSLTLDERIRSREEQRLAAEEAERLAREEDQRPAADKAAREERTDAVIAAWLAEAAQSDAPKSPCMKVMPAVCAVLILLPITALLFKRKR